MAVEVACYEAGQEQEGRYFVDIRMANPVSVISAVRLYLRGMRKARNRRSKTEVLPFSLNL